MADYDLFVIGAGSGGVSASRRAAHFGAKVGICEGSLVGGTCVIRGCVPKKIMVYASEFAEQFSSAKNFGWSVDGDISFDWKTLIKNKDKEINRLNGIYKNMLKNSNVDLIDGYASFVDENTVEINGKKITADKFLISTGGKPFVPDIKGKEFAITSDDIFYLDELPKKIVIVGGGYIAIEFACILHGLGSDVSLIYRGEKILRNFDEDIQSHLMEELTKKSLNIVTNTDVIGLEKNSDSTISVSLKNKDGEESQTEVDAVLYSTGRIPNISTLNLEGAKVDVTNKGSIAIDENFKTSNPNIFALGDVANKNNLTPVAINEGRAFSESQFGNSPRVIDYTNIASAVFSQPEVASCGLTESQAKDKYSGIDIYLSKFRPLKNTIIGNDEKTMMKIIVDTETDLVLGAHMVGVHAAEIMQGVAIAMKCGATKAQFDSTIGIHPSAAEEFVTMREKYVTM